MNKKIIFIYNADDSFSSKAIDFIHKIVNPETYQCSLCTLTYGNVSMKKEWKAYIGSLEYDVDFLYKNAIQVDSKFCGIPTPCILQMEGEKYNVLIDSIEVNSFSSLQELIRVLKARL